MKNFFRSFGFAGRGIRAGIRGQRNIMVMLFLALVAIGLGLTLGITLQDWAMVVFCCGLVLSLELVNTAVEQLLDLMHPDSDPTVGRIKDIMAGAVLVASMAAAVVGGLVFIPYF